MEKIGLVKYMLSNGLAAPALLLFELTLNIQYNNTYWRMVYIDLTV